jgi:hypothetical protein
MSLSLEGDAEAGIEYPVGQEKRFEFSDVPLSVYEGEFVIAVIFSSAPSASKIDLTLTYQACNDNACLPIATQRISTQIAHRR